MTKKTTLQDLFLAGLRRGDCPVTVFLVNGFQIRGSISAYDAFTVMVRSEGKQNLIFKHAISTISPLHNVDISSWEGTDS